MTDKKGRAFIAQETRRRFREIIATAKAIINKSTPGFEGSVKVPFFVATTRGKLSNITFRFMNLVAAGSMIKVVILRSNEKLESTFIVKGTSPSITQQWDVSRGDAVSLEINLMPNKPEVIGGMPDTPTCGDLYISADFSTVIKSDVQAVVVSEEEPDVGSSIEDTGGTDEGLEASEE